MPACPRCGDGIIELNHFVSVRKADSFTINPKTGEGVYLDESIYQLDTEEMADEQYCCPECFENLFKTESKALEFLKGEGDEEK